MSGYEHPSWQEEAEMDARYEAHQDRVAEQDEAYARAQITVGSLVRDRRDDTTGTVTAIDEHDRLLVAFPDEDGDTYEDWADRDQLDPEEGE